MIKKISILCLLFFLVGCGEVKYHTIDSNKAIELINNGAMILDVRTSDEYNTGHIKNSKNIPVDMINSVDFDKDSVIIVYCATGVRSANASEQLYSMGYKNIYNLDGGIINWGFELE